MSVTPVFLLSLPRSGSTLVQRVLAHHPQVATASEPWLMLPLAATLRPRVPFAGGWHRGNRIGLEDFAATLPEGLDSYRGAIRDAALRLYGEAAGPGARFFVDKTPPYFLVADELMAIFPEGRFLFLWRHPLSVVGSVVETFCDGRWRPGDYVSSLFVGLDNLVAAYERHGDRAVGVRYEDLVGGGQAAWEDLAARLGLPFDAGALERFGEVELSGWLGDQTGRAAYGAVDAAPLAKWRATITTPVRRAWARRYLRWIGEERLAVMGYRLDALLAELDTIETNGASARRDTLELARSLARDVAKSQVQRTQRPPSAWAYLLRPQAAADSARVKPDRSPSRASSSRE